MNTSTGNTIRYCFTESNVNSTDITCVYAALQKTHPQKLLDVLLENQLAWKTDTRALSESVQSHLLGKTTSILNLMHSIEPLPLAEPNRIIIPIQTFSYQGYQNLIKREIRAALLNIESSSCLSSSIDYALSIPELLHKLKSGNFELAECNVSNPVNRVEMLVSKSWAEILGYAMWLPSSLTEYEQYAELAHIFWIMSYSGLAEVFFDAAVSDKLSASTAQYEECDLQQFRQEHALKMAHVSELLNFNSSIDVSRASPLLKKSA